MREIITDIIQQAETDFYLKFTPDLSDLQNGSLLLEKEYKFLWKAADGTIDETEANIINLPTRATGTIRYFYRLPKDIGESLGSFYLAAGAAVNLSELIELGGTATDTFLDALEAAIDEHEAAANPHPDYLTQSEGDGLYKPIGAGASGAAGGVLLGTYPNPGFAADMATQAELDAQVALIPATVRATVLTGLGVGTNTPIASTDTVLAAFANLQKQISNVSGGITIDSSTITSGTDGRVLFQSAGVVSQSGNLFWDLANNRLGIGTSAPVGKLHIAASSGGALTDKSIIIESEGGFGVVENFSLNKKGEFVFKDRFARNLFGYAESADLIYAATEVIAPAMRTSGYGIYAPKITGYNYPAHQIVFDQADILVIKDGAVTVGVITASGNWLIGANLTVGGTLHLTDGTVKQVRFDAASGGKKFLYVDA